MANQFTGLAPENVAEEVKELNYDNYQYEIEKYQEEIAGLKLENRELKLSKEKLTNKLVKKKNELENERISINTFRQYIQDLKTKIAQLEKGGNRPTAHPGSVLTEEVVERLILEKTGLESQVCEQRKEINSSNDKLDLTNQELEISRANLTRSEELTQELKLDYAKLDDECKLGKNLFQEALQSISGEKDTLQQQLENKIKLKGLENEKLKSDYEDLVKCRKQLESQLKAVNEKYLALENVRISEANLEKNRIKLEEMQRLEIGSKIRTQEQITDLTSEITSLRNELTSERGNSRISKQLIRKLNEEVEELQVGEAGKIQESKILLGQAENARSDTERKLGELTKEMDRAYEVKDKQIQDLTSKQTKLCQQIESLQQENAKIQLEFSNNPTIHKLTAELDLSKDEIIKLTNNNRKLETNKIEMENQLRKQLSELEHQILQLQNDSDAQRLTIEEQHKQIYKYKQQQTEIKESNARNTSEGQINDLKMQNVALEAYTSPYKPLPLPFPYQLHELGGSWSSFRNPAPQMNQIIVPKYDQPWKCTFCGSTHPTERDRDIHMTNNCTFSPISRQADTYVTQGQGGRLPLPIADTIQTPNDPYYYKQRVTQSATIKELTPQIIPIANKTGKAPYKLFFKGKRIHVVKLKDLPSIHECINKQVICTVNGRKELGMLICEIDVEVFRGVTSKYLGIKLFSPEGNSDGTFRGKRVFECDPKYGMCVPFEDVFVPVI